MANVSLFIALPREQSMIIPGLELCDRLQRTFSSKDHLHSTLQTLDQRILKGSRSLEINGKITISQDSQDHSVFNFLFNAFA
jgi:hypothetical protein